MKTCIVTSSGTIVDVLAPISNLSIEDIAHSLAYKPRFNGHLSPRVSQDMLGGYYTVAHHCLEVSRQCPPDCALDGLLHDAHEAITGDIPSPVKAAMEYLGIDIHSFEATVQRSVRLGLGLLPEMYPEVEYAVDMADKHVLLSEVATCFDESAREAWGLLGWQISDAHGYLSISSPDEAKAEFIQRYYELTEDIDSWS